MYPSEHCSCYTSSFNPKGNHRLPKAPNVASSLCMTKRPLLRSWSKPDSVHSTEMAGIALTVFRSNFWDSSTTSFKGSYLREKQRGNFSIAPLPLSPAIRAGCVILLWWNSRVFYSFSLSELTDRGNLPCHFWMFSPANLSATGTLSHTEDLACQTIPFYLH